MPFALCGNSCSQGDITQTNSVRIPSGTGEYVTLAHFQLDEEKTKHACLCPTKMVLVQHNCTIFLSMVTAQQSYAPNLTSDPCFFGLGQS
jgi:hypothetical protein